MQIIGEPLSSASKEAVCVIAFTNPAASGGAVPFAFCTEINQ